MPVSMSFVFVHEFQSQFHHFVHEFLPFLASFDNNVAVGA